MTNCQLYVSIYRVNRTERLIAISEHLRARRTGVTAESLSDRFGVSVRTIYRDLDTLRAAHMPLNAEPGPGGGYALDRSYALPPVNFTVDEASLLVCLADWVRRQRMIPFVDTLDDAAQKVRATLPPRVCVAVDRRAADVAFIGVPALPIERDVRRAIEQAWINDRPVRMRYLGAYGETERVVRIRNLVVDRRETRLNCDDLDKGEPRQFLLHKVLSVQLLSS